MMIPVFSDFFFPSEYSLLFSQIPPELPERHAHTHVRARVGNKPAEPQLRRPGGFGSNGKQKTSWFSHRTSGTEPVYLSGSDRVYLDVGRVGRQDRKSVEKKNEQISRQHSVCQHFKADKPLGKRLGFHCTTSKTM